MITEVTLEKYGFIALYTRYKDKWFVNLSQNSVPALTGSTMKKYIEFLELVTNYLDNLQKEGDS